MNETNYQPLDRRPIQSRNTFWAKLATRLLVWTGLTPNTISLLGMVVAVIAGTALYSTSITSGGVQRCLWFIVAILCQLRLLCNLLDGMVAIARQMASPQGELYNDVPDRISDAVILIGLGYAVGATPALGYIAALVSIFVAYVRSLAKSVGAPHDFCGPMAKPHRMAIVTVLALYMALFPDAWRLAWSEPNMVLAVIIAGGFVTALRRLARAARQLEGVS